MARAIIEGSTFKYDYSLKSDGSAVVAMDLEKAFAFSTLADNLKAALGFALKTAMRNASAGKMDTEEAAQTAFAAGKKRAEAMEAGKWQAQRESTGEAGERITLLDKALAQFLGVSDDEAHDQIVGVINAALESAKIDPDEEPTTDAEKKARSKIVRDTRKALRESAELREIMDTLELQAKQAELARKAKARTDTTAPSLGSLLK